MGVGGSVLSFRLFILAMCVSGVEAVDDPKGREDGTEDGKLAN